jgi:hypothetical protein
MVPTLGMGTLLKYEAENDADAEAEAEADAEVFELDSTEAATQLHTPQSELR